MKHIIYLIAVIFLFGCQKDEKLTEPNNLGFNESIVTWNGSDRKPTVIDETGARIGEYFEIYYKESATLDNYLTNDTIPRQTAYDKKQIDSISLNRIPKSNSIKIPVNGVYVKHFRYKLTLWLKNGSHLVHGTVWSVAQGDNLTYVPFGDYVINAGLKIEVERTKDKRVFGNWITSNDEEYYLHRIKYNGIYIQDQYLRNQNGGWFLMPHK